MPPRAGDTLRIGLVGCGRIGVEHRAALLKTHGVSLAGIVDPQVPPGCGDWPTVGSLGALIERVDVDAVVVAASTSAHASIVEEALLCGLDVLCEKPLTLDVEQSLALGRLAETTGRLLQIGYWRRFAAPYLSMRDLCEGGPLGAVTSLRAAQWDGRPPPPGFCDPRVSGGLEVDCGVHEFDLARWLTGADVEAVTSCSPQPLSELAEVGDVDTVCGLALLGGERTMTIDLTRRAGYADSIRSEVIGERGSAALDFAITGTLVVRHGDVREESELAADVIGDALRAQLSAFAAGVRDRKLHEDAATAYDCACALDAALALQGARDSKRWLPVPTTLVANTH